MKLTTLSLSNTGPNSKASLPSNPSLKILKPVPVRLKLRPARERKLPSPTRRKNYWTNYRGPNRDGRYEELPVITSWPAGGLTPIWKQPIGIGYASFTVADGAAFTIEQRRRQEVAAAYDVSHRSRTLDARLEC